MGAIIAALIELFTKAFNVLPLPARHAVVRLLVRIVLAVSPKHLRVAEQNLQRAFPERSEQERKQILEQSIQSFVRVIVDFIRLPSLDVDWIRAHVSVPSMAKLVELSEQHGKGVLIATGHLGSFELMAYAVAALGHPLSFVVRNAKMPSIDAWWRKTRERLGNTVIARRGAISEVITQLRAGRDVGILFDQNVTANHAVFVPWFGELAATTKAVGLAALKTRCPIAVSSVRFDGNDHYTVTIEELPWFDIDEDQALSLDEKVLQITKRAAAAFEKRIRDNPGEWFWMHRRWKTKPPSAL